MQLTDEEIDPEISFSQVLSLSFFQNVTALVLYLKNSKIIILLKNIPHGLPCQKIFEFRIFNLQLLAGPPPRKSQGRPVRSGTRRLKNQATAGKLFRTLAFVFAYLFNLKRFENNVESHQFLFFSGGTGIGAHPVVLAYSEQVLSKEEH